MAQSFPVARFVRYYDPTRRAALGIDLAQVPERACFALSNA